LLGEITDAQVPQATDLESLEVAARGYALEMAAGILEAALNGDHSDYRGSQIRCRCGGSARYVDRRAKTVVTVLGEITLRRAYYCCSECGHGITPKDRALNLSTGSLSPGVLRMVGTTAALVSFQETDELLESLAGVRIGAKHAERAAESLGEAIATDESVRLHSQEPCSPTMYLGMDGTGAPMRRGELAGRAGKQPDGSAKTREVKMATVWSADARDHDGTPVRDPGSVSYNAAIESASTADTEAGLSPFAMRVQREASRRGFDLAKRQVVIGDGAKWIWNIADELFPEAIQIIDLYHAKGTLSDTAKAIFGAESELAHAWAKARHEELDDGRFDELLAALMRHQQSNDSARTCHEYFLANRSRMRYPQFRRLGLCTSSGVVEAGCKLVVGTRLKRAGMHWSLFGANSIIALRCCKLSQRYDEYWNSRSSA